MSGICRGDIVRLKDEELDYIVLGWCSCSQITTLMPKLLLLSGCIKILPYIALTGVSTYPVEVPVRSVEKTGKNKEKELDLYFTKQVILGNRIIQDFLYTRKEFLNFRKEMYNNVKAVYPTFAKLHAGDAFQEEGKICYYMGMPKEKADIYFTTGKKAMEPDIIIQCRGNRYNVNVGYLMNCERIPNNFISVDKKEYVDFSYIERKYLCK